CPEDRKRLSVGRRENEGSYAIAFLINVGDPHLSKPAPRRRLFLTREARIPRRWVGAQVLLEQCLERTLPALAKRGDPQCALQLLAGMSWQIQEGIGVGHCDSFRTIGDFHNVVAGPDFSLLQHAKVESWPVMG